MRNRPPSLRRLALLLNLPLVLLAAMALWVLRTERERSEAGLRKEALLWAGALTEEAGDDSIEQGIREKEVRVPRWQWEGNDPPPAGSAAQRWEAARKRLREGKAKEAATELRSLLSSAAEQDVTSTGLPLLPMVRRTLLDAEPGEANAKLLCHQAIMQPSMLTARLVHDAAPHLPESQRSSFLRRALQTEELLHFMKRRGHGGPRPPPDSWHCETTTDTETVLCMHLENVREAVERRMRWFRSMLPSWAGTNLTWHGHAVLAAPGEELAAVTRPPWRFAISLAAPERFTEEWHRRLRWLAWLLATAMLVTAFALAMAYRGFKKQAEFSRLQSEFVASVSHELRTPVASIGVLAERLEEGKADAEQTVQYHRFIAREGRRLAGLVDNVLDFSRIERGAKRYEFEHADLPRLVRETAALMRPHAEEKGVTVTESIQDVPESVWPPVDAVTIRQALVNLLDNAIKFTPAGGSVFVGFTSDNGSVTLNVRDTGVGIPSNEHAKIFERFHRVDNGLRRETTGAGIGLSLVKHIVEAHGGKVKVESREGQGAMFTMRLPRNNEDLKIRNPKSQT